MRFYYGLPLVDEYGGIANLLPFPLRITNRQIAARWREAYKKSAKIKQRLMDAGNN